MDGQLTLSELNFKIRDALSDAFPKAVWVVAEISEMKVNRTGHCYLELIEKDRDTDEITARARATIWSFTFRMVKPYFESATGQAFTEGLKILVMVSVEYHPAYGLSLNVKDIDPTYTLGDLARRRKEIIKKLEEAGVFDMNRELPFPLVPQRIAIISSSTAAGYGDFIRHLAANTQGFRFHCRLFEAAMQGSEAAPDIMAALDDIFREEDSFDVVVIIRGGGAQADLSCFDNFDLAYAVAQFPLPVITGIGHDKDDTIIDLIAHTRQKTPTAVAGFLIDALSAFDNRLNALGDEITERVREILDEKAEKTERLAENVKTATARLLSVKQQQLIRSGYRIKSGISRYVTDHGEQLHRLRHRATRISILLLQKKMMRNDRLTREINFRISSLLTKEQERLRRHFLALSPAVRSRLQITEKVLGAHESSLRMLDPVNVLKRGFTLTLQEGKVVKSATSLLPSETMETRFHDGSVISQIIKK